MTLKGQIECLIMPGQFHSVNTYGAIGVSGASTSWNADNEAFITLYNFFNNLTAIGVTRIAYNIGSSGTGMTYWDLGAPPGNGAWALFRFGNAKIPFYVLLQSSNIQQKNQNFAYSGYAGCQPCITSESDGTLQTGSGICLGLSIAMRLDGGSPWNGTTNNNGADTKGTPVWTAGGSTLAVWPRSNSSGGARSANTDAIIPFIGTKQSTFGGTYPDSAMCGLRLQCLADENNLLLLATNNYSNGTSTYLCGYTQFYFGKYTPRIGITPQIPYVCLSRAWRNSAGFEVPFLKTIYGLTTLSVNGGTNGDGGIPHPTASLGVKIAYVDYPSMMLMDNFNPNRGIPATQPVNSRFDIYPIYLCVFEAPYKGWIGTIDFVRQANNLPVHGTTSDKQLAFFGSPNINFPKLIVPWDGATIPGSGISRSGISF